MENVTACETPKGFILFLSVSTVVTFFLWVILAGEFFKHENKFIGLFHFKSAIHTQRDRLELPRDSINQSFDRHSPKRYSSGGLFG